MIPNPKLVDAIVTPLIGHFDAGPAPWWWPCGSGTNAAQWGVGAGRRAEFASLIARPAPRAQDARPVYDGFRGSLGSTTSSCRLWVLSSRPSMNYFPAGGTTRLLNVLRANNWLDCTHVTDVIKFRGVGPDRLAHEGLDDEHWVLSLNALCSEFEETLPDVILLAGKRAQGWVNTVLRARAHQWPTLEHLFTRIVPVPFWGNGVVDPPGSWRAAVQAAGHQIP